ncbi:murein hydrolase activator EnvC family protein [Chengkuizengella axinellae]|uniref:Peptidoglycan DD-metalloendopeptidase family protein n=1 Tax=Chengkuizengella axinellae TaxID=3064388 RepID=A0ABT9J2V5_9BACL|nr:peptidoglycan DD-metalloendopeptidase family protein [Chengkuizengella sp. 2205SS18-9]MDP5275915.1 peptidoglycan DD-metalloendopeptidase family protein [Chengkuizengella sp. 2205SS18-9]
MLKKVFVVFLLSLFILTSILLPDQGQADDSGNIEQINAQINEAKAKRQQAQKDKQIAIGIIRNYETKIASTEQEIHQLELEIEKKNQEIAELEGKINQTFEELDVTKEELDDAIQRVIDRNELLQSRLYIMYTNGSVSYLDVMLSATSFTDFLERFEALNTILSNDKVLLEERKHDQAIIEEKKASIEATIALLNEDFEELEQKRLDLTQQEKDKAVAISTFNEEKKNQEEVVHEADEIDKESEELMNKLIAERQKLLSKNLKFNGNLAYPLPQDGNYRITSKFGTRTDPFTGKTSSHTGVDIAAPGGTNILASGDGVVIVAEYYYSYGNAVVIDHGSGITTLYGHMKQINVTKGQNVSQGDKIGEVGTTGRSTGNHLHFEVRKDGTRVEPNDYVSLY